MMVWGKRTLDGEVELRSVNNVCWCLFSSDFVGAYVDKNEPIVLLKKWPYRYELIAY